MSAAGYDADTHTFHLPLPEGVTEADVSPPPGDYYTVLERLAWALEWAMQYWGAVGRANEELVEAQLAEIADLAARTDGFERFSIVFHPFDTQVSL